MTGIDALKKDELFRHPDMTTAHFGRRLSSVMRGDRLWTAVQIGRGRQTGVLVVCTNGDDPPRRIIGPMGLSNQPYLTTDPSGQGVVVIWNEATERGWDIRCAHLPDDTDDFGEVETVFSHNDLCLPPTAACHDGVLHVAWAALTDGGIRIHWTQGATGRWDAPEIVSPVGIDAFRPTLCPVGQGICLAWDQYREKKYEVVLATFERGQAHQVTTQSVSSEQHLCARLIGAPDATAYMTWLVLQPVIDESLGIIDHAASAMVGRYRAGGFEILTDPTSAIDERAIGDLREGLLASEIYKGYVGLRRNPQLTIDSDNAVQLVWEMRRESPKSGVTGHLVSRTLDDTDHWSPPVSLGEIGYGYAVPPAFSGPTIPTAFLKFDEHELDVVQSARLDPARATPMTLPSDKWSRWTPTTITPQTKPTSTIDLDGKTYRIFWADTHCHSNVSPDTEGQVDELIHFARDQAGLDAVCVIDNDYYPHKALTEPEWRIHQVYARHFTVEGRFVVLPGYEFTYHRTDLEPDFNHRCVIYPRGGPLRRRIDPESDTDAKMIERLKHAGGMAYPHHCTYRLIDRDVEWNIEACSSWRVCVEETDFTMRQLRAGARIGFIGSSDTHRCVPGLGGARTGLIAEALTPEALFDAYRNRRCLATQGHNIFVDLRAAGRFIGQSGNASGAPVVEAIVEAPVPIAFVELLRDAEPIARFEPNDLHFQQRFTDTEVSCGPHFYHARIKLVGDPSLNVDGDPRTNPPMPFSQDSRYPHNLARAQGPFAWTSPIHLTVQ